VTYNQLLTGHIDGSLLLLHSKPVLLLSVIKKIQAFKKKPVFLDGQHISEVTSHTHLGVELARNLRWNQHIHTISLNARRRLNAMIPLKFN
jgi:hypothetical protein